MTAELGVFMLTVALATALLQAAFLLPSCRALSAMLMPRAALLQAAAVTLALLVLVVLRLDNDFTVANVVGHSNLALPALYKIAGTWGNHEGSMLLWAWVLAMFGFIHSTGSEQTAQRHATLAVQALLLAGVVLFILFTSNPFARIFPPAVDGEMLNPLLQDIALAMHPPLLYVGYVGFSIVFSMAVAVLLTPGDIQDWAKRAHPWIMASWSALTLGIGLGSWWAYRELGWGGWWFWDPVENASLLPWLAGTALLHSNRVLITRGVLPGWVLLLSILTFALSLLGTFLVRSGALTSVHSFASDPARGLFILLYIALSVGAALAIYGMRAGQFHTQGGMRLVSREGMIVFNNLFLLTACATVLLGTLYPLFAEWLAGHKLTVGAPYFNRTFLPLMLPPLALAGLVPFMPWKSASFRAAFHQALPALAAAATAMFLVAVYVSSSLVLWLVGIGLAGWLAAASLQWLRRAQGVKGRWPVFLGHMGAALLVAGITGSSLGRGEVEKAMQPGDVLQLAGYGFTLERLENAGTENYSSIRAHFAVRDPAGRQIASMAPEYRNYRIRNIATSEAALQGASIGGDLYLVVGEPLPDSGRIAVRAYHMPMIGFIWGGFMLMALGGAMAAAGGIRRRDAL